MKTKTARSPAYCTRSTLTTSEQEDPLPPSPSLSVLGSSTQAGSFRRLDAFAFPILTPDGSVQALPDAPISPIDSHRRNRATPPAALSSLGAKTNMASSADLEPSVGSLTDQYDMLDDVSISSNDDHETASLASTPHPSDDEDGTVFFRDHGSLVNLAGPGQTLSTSSFRFVTNTDASVSSLTDDLDTPRQSILSPASKVTQGADTLAEDARPSLRVLFVAHRNLSPEVMQRICDRLAGSSYASCGLGVQQCVDATVASLDTSSCKLYIRHPDKIKPISVNAYDASDFPDLAIFYLTDRAGSATYPAWFDTVKRSMASFGVPTLTIMGSNLDTRRLDSEQLDKIYDSDLVLPYEVYMSKDITALQVDLDNVLRIQEAATEAQPVSTKTVPHSAFGTRGTWLGMGALLMYMTCISICLAVWQFSYASPWQQDTAAILVARREALSDALVSLSNSVDAQQISNIEHLLPRLTASVADDDADYVPFQGLPPNHVVVSLLRQPGSRTFPAISSSHVYTSSNNSISHNLTRLIDGVYAVTLAPESAFGQVWVNVLVQNPYLNVTASHDFGRRPFQITMPGTAIIAQAATKELMVVRDATVSWTNRLAAPLTAGLKATRNVTTELAIYAARDLQLFGNTALSMITKAARESNMTMASIRRDLMVVQKDVIVWTGNLQNALSETAHALMPSRSGLRETLDRSHQQARRLTLPLRRKWNSMRKPSSGNPVSDEQKPAKSKATTRQTRVGSKALFGPLSEPAAGLSEASGLRAKDSKRQHHSKAKGSKKSKASKPSQAAARDGKHDLKKGGPRGSSVKTPGKQHA